MFRIGIGLNFEPDDGLEAALLHFSLDQRALALAVDVVVI